MVGHMLRLHLHHLVVLNVALDGFSFLSTGTSEEVKLLLVLRLISLVHPHHVTLLQWLLREERVVEDWHGGTHG